VTGTVAVIERDASSAMAVSDCVGVDMMIEGEPRLSMNGELSWSALHPIQGAKSPEAIRSDYPDTKEGIT